mmetsp:Transcript_1546/g.2052  ORF Transcript_1546/g.2052 Transcript_1546/m.2052 type:complete len:398 (-) Transcript_1546:6-1199(-)
MHLRYIYMYNNNNKYYYGLGLCCIYGITGLSFGIYNNNNVLANNNNIANEIENQQRQHRWRQLKVFTGTSNPELSNDIAQILGTKLGKISIKKFADGEIGIQVLENVRGKDIFIVQPTCPSLNGGVNDNLMELILLISTMRRASAHSITAVLPYYGYARQDRKMRSRVPISAADVARLLESVGVDRVVAVDLHCGQIQGFFGPRTPCDNLDGSIVALPFFRDELQLNDKQIVVVSPDAGGVYRAKQFREGLKNMGIKTSLAMIIKQRSEPGKVASMDLVGSVENCDCIIVDDMIDTAGTLCKAGNELKKRGANNIYAFATHGLFSNPAINRINNSIFEKVVTTNTIPLGNKLSDKIHVLSIAQLLAKAIYSIHFRTSISALFDIEFGEIKFEKQINH